MNKMIILLLTAKAVFGIDIVLEENDDVIITNIDQIDYYNGEILITDRSSGDVVIYDTTGRISESIKAGLQLSEMVANHYNEIKYYENYYFRNNEIIPTNLEDYNKLHNINLNYEQYYSRVNNKFGYGKILDSNRILLLGHPRFKARIKDSLRNWILNQTVLFEYNRTMKKYKILFSKSKKY
jgi:hypothetical protein